MSVSPIGSASIRSSAPASRSFGPAPSSSSGSSAGLAVIQIVLLLSFPFLMQSADGERGLIALITATILIGLVSRTPAFGVPLTLFYVVIMSGLRRWLIPVFGYAANDPFMLVTPVVVVLNFVALLLQRQIPRDSTLARLVMWFVIVMGVEALNPLQGGLAVGFGGLLLLTVPILWYYLARVTLSAILMDRLFKLALILAVCCTLYGLYQQFVGLMPSEIEYIRITKYSQVMSANTSRVFSTLSGFAEYAYFIALGAVIAFAFALRKNKIAIFVFAFLFLAAAFSSSRGVLVAVLATCMVLWAVQGKSMVTWWPRLVVAALVGIGGLVWSLKQVKDNDVLKGNISASELIGHQTQLLDPFQKGSTGGDHVSLQVNGVVTGILHPFGYGTGSVTLAATKFGNEETQGFSSEGDFGNAFIALGITGGVLYLCLVYTVFRNAFLNWHYFRDSNSLCSLAVVTAATGQWLAGGNYIIAMLVWFSVGYIDRAGIERRRNTEIPAPAKGREAPVARRRRSNRVSVTGSNA